MVSFRRVHTLTAGLLPADVKAIPSALVACVAQLQRILEFRLCFVGLPECRVGALVFHDCEHARC